MTATRVDLPTVTLAAVRGTMPMSELRTFYDSAFAQVAQAVQREGWTIIGPAVGWYHRVPDGTVDLSAGFPVQGAAAGTSSGGVQVVELPGGDALTATHTGGYDGLPEAWDRLESDRATLGVAGRGDLWEEYVTEPEPDGDPTANVTRLVLPLAVTTER